jgi:uncharacterized protein YegP (UPF0339 family)
LSSIFTLPRVTAIDSAGKPYANALLYFYDTGTSDPANTYQDDDLTTPHANPVVANSAGVFPVIYQDPETTYRVTLRQSNGTLIYTSDPLGSSQSAENISVDYDVIEAVPLNLHDYIEDTGEFLLMGFIPPNLKSAIRARTSTADITEYFQTAHDAIVDERQTGQIRLPMGRVSTVARRDFRRCLGRR